MGPPPAPSAGARQDEASARTLGGGPAPQQHAGYRSGSGAHALSGSGRSWAGAAPQRPSATGECAPLACCVWRRTPALAVHDVPARRSHRTPSSRPLHAPPPRPPTPRTARQSYRRSGMRGQSGASRGSRMRDVGDASAPIKVRARRGAAGAGTGLPPAHAAPRPRAHPRRRAAAPAAARRAPAARSSTSTASTARPSR